MTFLRGRTAFVAARCGIAAFCWTTAGYAFMSASPFVYRQFLAPRVFRWPGAFSDWHAVSYWLWLAVAVAQIVHLLRHGPARSLASAFATMWSLVGIFLIFHPILPQLADDRRSVIVGLIALTPVIWLAVLDHVRYRRLLDDERPAESDEGRLLMAAWATAAFVTIVFAMLTPIAAAGQFEPDLLTTGLAAGFAWNVTDHLVIFSAAFLVLAAVDRACMRARLRVRYAACLACLVLAVWLATERTVSEPLGFTGAWSAAVSLACSVSIVAAWSSFRLRRWVDEIRPASSAWELLFGPPGDMARPAPRLLSLGVLALAAYAIGAVSRVVDWDFLLLRSGLFVLWIAGFSQSFRIVPRGVRVGAAATAIVCLAPLVAYVAASSQPRIVPRHALDRYRVYNPSFRVAEDLLRDAASEDDAFQRFLRENSGLGGRVDASPVSIDLAPLGEERASRRPFVFLFVIDSLRQDYLQPYNTAVGFTPNIARFAGESLVFRNAFTAYGGTGLSVPAIWSGSVGVHKQYVTPFAPMNALDKLLEANGYRKFLSFDSIVTQLLPPSSATTELDYGFRNEEFRFCRTVAELETKLAGTARDEAVFAYTLPQDLHISNIISASVPPGESYPGFHAPYASRVHRIDGCFGEFIDFLKHRGWYDSSVVVLTADHGEMLGEDGFWGHVYYLFPPVLQVPLMVHLPPGAPGRAGVDLDAVSLTTDITPTIYATLGYEPRRGLRLIGRPLVGADAQAQKARQDHFVVAASYSAVYGVLSSNGRRLYIVDAVQHREYSYVRDASARWNAVPVTEGARESGRRVIREHLRDVNRVYQVHVR